MGWENGICNRASSFKFAITDLCVVYKPSLKIAEIITNLFITITITRITKRYFPRGYFVLTATTLAFRGAQKI